MALSVKYGARRIGVDGFCGYPRGPSGLMGDEHVGTIAWVHWTVSMEGIVVPLCPAAVECHGDSWPVSLPQTILCCVHVYSVC
jgi:hypothetical protein